MNTEIEIKFCSVDIDTIQKQLEVIGAHCEHPMRLLRRYTFDNPFTSKKNAFVRVRDEGHKVTMTYKQFDELSLHGAKEIEIEVNDFDAATRLLLEIGAGQTASSYQESRRETWRLGEVEIVIDEWPWLSPYIEIEASTEELVRKTASDLNLEWNRGVFGDVMAAYRLEYPHLAPSDTIGRLSEVRFGAPLPDLLQP